jgi:hypothetical protein
LQRPPIRDRTPVIPIQREDDAIAESLVGVEVESWQPRNLDRLSRPLLRVDVAGDGERGEHRDDSSGSARAEHWRLLG